MLEITTQGMFNGMGKTTPPVHHQHRVQHAAHTAGHLPGCPHWRDRGLVGHQHHFYLQGDYLIYVVPDLAEAFVKNAVTITSSNR